MARTRSPEDTRFWNQFLMITMVLHVIIIGFFVLARSIGASQAEEQSADPSVQTAIDQRIRPPVRVAVAGQPAPEEPEAEPAQTAGAAAAAPQVATVEMNGEQAYQAICGTCHAAGIAGAPRFGDAAAWGPRIAKGTAVLYQHSVEGFHGEAGFMPPKGGRPDLSDESVHKAVDYMVAGARK
jgi:cytochrome c5